MKELDDIAEAGLGKILDVLNARRRRDIDEYFCASEVRSTMRALQRDTLAAVMGGAPLEREGDPEGATVGRARVSVDDDGGVSIDVAGNRTT